MPQTINVKTLMHEMRQVVERVRMGEEFTVLYRRRPAFRIVPVDGALGAGAPETDSLYRAGAVGRSKDGLTSADHNRALYGDSAPMTGR